MKRYSRKAGGEYSLSVGIQEEIAHLRQGLSAAVNLPREGYLTVSKFHD